MRPFPGEGLDVRVANQLRIATQLVLLVILVTSVATLAVGELLVRDSQSLLQRRAVDVLQELAGLRELAIEQDMRLFGQFVREAVKEFATPFEKGTDRPSATELDAQLRLALKALREPAGLSHQQRFLRRDLDPASFVEVCYLQRQPDGKLLHQAALRRLESDEPRRGPTQTPPVAEVLEDIAQRPGEQVYFSSLRVVQEPDMLPRCLVTSVYPVWPKQGLTQVYLGVTFDLSRMLHNADRRHTRDMLVLVDQAGTILAHPDAGVIGKNLHDEPGWDFPGTEWQPASEGRISDTDLEVNGGSGIDPDHAVRDPRLRFTLARLPVPAEFVRKHGKELADDLDRLAAADPSLQAQPPTTGNPLLELAAPTSASVEAAIGRLPAQRGSLAELPRSGWRRIHCERLVARLVPLRLVLREQDQKQTLRLIVCAALEEINEEIATETAWSRFAWPVPIILIASVLALIAAYLIARPLQRLTKASEQLARGDYSVDLDVQGSGEVAQLARVLKLTIAEIRQRDASLREANETLEARVHDRTAELEEARVKLEHALHAAQAADRAKENFLRTMSHELRQPLNIVIGYTEAIREEAVDAGNDEILPDLDKIHAAGRHLLTLINDILDLTKIRAGKMDLRLKEFDLKALLGEVSDMVDPLVKKNDNRFLLVAPDPAGSMFADDVRLKQVLINLLSNASKFTSGGTIELTVERTPGTAGEEVVFTVRDTGKGMSAAQLEKLFEPFYQADSSIRREQGGTGLGLTITKALCELMGGTVSVTSQEGAGSTFVVRLPARVGQRGPGSDWSIDLRTVGGPFNGRRGETVLVIDDEPGVRELMERFLTREGFAVRTASNSEEGIRLARQWQPSVITLDVMMPGVDGWATLAALKTDPATQDIPVVMLTIVDDRRRGFKLGASEYLTKPIDWQRLGVILQKYVERGCTAPVLVVDDDPDNRALTRGYLTRAGWNVIEAENGLVALERFRENRPSLILLDLMMPVMDGFQFLEELNRSGQRDGVPVVVLTAKDLTEEDRARLNGGVARILQKGDMTQVQDLEGLLHQLVQVVRPGAGPVHEEEPDAPAASGG
jgi:signal transduction histidine kinase/DNA-binding response OmpR family regulator